MLNYMGKYVYFINIIDGSLFLYINSDQVQHKALSSLIANNFLFDQIESNHQATVTRFILGSTPEQHFALAIKKRKYIIARKVMPKFFNWPIPLKNI